MNKLTSNYRAARNLELGREKKKIKVVEQHIKKNQETKIKTTEKE